MVTVMRLLSSSCHSWVGTVEIIGVSRTNNDSTIQRPYHGHIWLVVEVTVGCSSPRLLKYHTDLYDKLQT
jgi:hypothetical protein